MDGWLMGHGLFVIWTLMGYKSAFHTEISLLKAAINKWNRCFSNDGDFSSKCLMKTLK